jgi:transcriptional regulator with XRE-family HTH domain
MMQERGWNQTKLALESGVNRISISGYVRGVSVPSAPSLDMLAKALNTTPEELLPNRGEDGRPRAARPVPREPSGRSGRSIELRVEPDAPDRAWLRVEQVVRTSTALKVLVLLEADSTEGSDPSE